MFAFSGAHRTGKTTTAKRVSECLGIPYHDASVTRIMNEIGCNPVSDLSITDRLKAQRYLLKRHIEDISVYNKPFVTDRTPLDFIGYTLAEVTMHNTSSEIGEEIRTYVRECMQALERHYCAVIILMPLPGFEIDPTKPPRNLAYQDLHQLIVEGAWHRYDGAGCILGPASLDERVDASLELFQECIERARAENAQRLLN